MRNFWKKKSEATFQRKFWIKCLRNFSIIHDNLIEHSKENHERLLETKPWEIFHRNPQQNSERNQRQVFKISYFFFGWIIKKNSKRLKTLEKNQKKTMNFPFPKSPLEEFLKEFENCQYFLNIIWKVFFSKFWKNAWNIFSKTIMQELLSMDGFENKCFVQFLEESLKVFERNTRRNS